MADLERDPAWVELADVERWAAEVRAQDAMDARVRERWLRRSAEEDADLAGLLLALAERRVTAVVTTTSGRRHPGRLAAVGSDFVAVRTDGDRTTLVAVAALASVRISGREPATAFGERRSLAVSMVDVLAHAAGRRPRVQVFCAAATVAGELRSVGTDVVTVRTDGDLAGLAYVSLASVSEISLLDSG